MMFRILSVIAMAIVVMSCSSSKSVKAPTLDMHTWEVNQIGAKDLDLVDEGMKPTMQFDSEKKQVTGSAGCNTYNGSYQLDPGTLRIGPVAATKKACEDMTIETAFLEALNKASKVDFDNSALRLLDANGVELLQARPMSK